MNLKIKKSDIQLFGLENSSYGFVYPKQLVYKGIKCRPIATHSRRIFLYKPGELVFKVGDVSQNVSDLKNWKVICRKYPQYQKYFAPTYRVLEKDFFNICVQKYVKHVKYLNKQAKMALIDLRNKFMFSDIGDYCNRSYNCGVDLKSRQLIIYDLGIEEIY